MEFSKSQAVELTKSAKKKEREEEKKKREKEREKLEAWKRDELPNILARIVSEVKGAANRGKCKITYYFYAHPEWSDKYDLDLQKVKCLETGLREKYKFIVTNKGLDFESEDDIGYFGTSRTYYFIVYIEWC